MEERKVICDTNVFIEFYKGNQEVVNNLKQIGVENILLSSVTAGELIFGALNKIELKNIHADINQLKIVHINKIISSKFIDLMIKHSLSHNLDLPDALIASSAIATNTKLYTLNLKHFKYIKDLELWKP